MRLESSPFIALVPVDTRFTRIMIAYPRMVLTLRSGDLRLLNIKTGDRIRIVIENASQAIDNIEGKSIEKGLTVRLKVHNMSMPHPFTAANKLDINKIREYQDNLLLTISCFSDAVHLDGHTQVEMKLKHAKMLDPHRDDILAVTILPAASP